MLQQRRVSIMKVSWTILYQAKDDEFDCCRSVGHADVGSPASSSTTSKPKPIGAIVGGVVGGIVLLLSAIILNMYLVRRNSRPNSVTDPSPLLMNETHIRSNSDTNNGYTSLSSSPMQRLSSPLWIFFFGFWTNALSFFFFSPFDVRRNSATSVRTLWVFSSVKLFDNCTYTHARAPLSRWPAATKQHWLTNLYILNLLRTSNTFLPGRSFISMIYFLYLKKETCRFCIL